MPIKFSTFQKSAVFLSALVIFSANSLFAQTSVKERAEIFEQVWSTISERYYDASFHGVDWKMVKKKYSARLKNAGSEREFYFLLDRMAGELRDSHTRVYSPAQRDERRKQKRAEVGISIKEIEGFAVIFSVAPGSEAERAGIKPGMIVRSVNNQPFKKAAAAARRSVGVSSSERATRMRVFSKILTGEPGTILNLELLDERGSVRKFTLERRVVSVKPQIVSKILPSGIAYLKFGKFDEEIEKQVAAALLELKDAPALILDLRGNAGGDGEVGLRFAGYFLDDRITVAKIVTRTGKPPFPEMPMTLEAGAPDARIFSRPVVILISENTASTAELMTNALQEQKRAVVFGTNSCGCVLAFLDYLPLKGGGDLTLSEFGFITPQGKKLEGKGVTPDRLIALVLQDLRTGHDRALEQAELFLKSSFKSKAVLPDSKK
jgi:carboxyl-terminal processing protease